MRGLCCFLLAFSLTVSAGLAFSADYDVRPVRIDSATRSGSNIATRVVFSAKAMTPAAPVIYQAKNITTVASTAAKLLRFGASPVGSAGIVAAASFYAWWQANYGPLLPDGQPVGAEQQGEGGSQGVAWNCHGVSGTVYSLTTCINAQKSQLATPSYSTWSYEGASWVNANTVATYAKPYPGAPVEVWGYSWVVGRPGGAPAPTLPLPPWLPGGDIPPEWFPHLGAEDTAPGGPISDAEFWDGFLNSPYADDFPALRDIQDNANGTPYNTPEVVQARNDIRDELSRQDGDAPLAYPPIPQYIPPAESPWHQEVFEPFQSADPGGGSAQAPAAPIPVFCEWAPTMCDWLDWTQEELPADIPDEVPTEASTAGTWSSGLDGGACPAPYVISALGASVPISWQPACDFVAMLRPILIAFAGIAAALILLGQRAGGAG